MKTEQITKIEETEFDAAQEAAERVDYPVFVHRFKKPITYDGKEYHGLAFNWWNLTGEDALAIENELERMGKTLIAPAFSSEYMIRMAVRACTEKIGADIFKRMPIFDYNKIRAAARSFLLKAES